MGRKINVKLILELRAAGMGRNQIAKTRKVSPIIDEWLLTELKQQEQSSSWS